MSEMLRLLCDAKTCDQCITHGPVIDIDMAELRRMAAEIGWTRSGDQDFCALHRFTKHATDWSRITQRARELKREAKDST